ncbi:hypothetical protein Hanom_Chr05g00455881 [Helianthus anomalus]
MATGAATSAVTSVVSVFTESVAVTAAELISPTCLSKKRKFVLALTAFEAIQAANVMPIVECVSSTPLEITPSPCGKPNLSVLISQASVAAAVSCPMPPPLPTTAVAVTTSPVSTPLPSSVTPSSLFDSLFSVFSATEKETPTVFAAHEATSARNAAMGDAGGSSSGIADDGARLGDDLFLPTINWDPNVQDKHYQPRWKIVESSRLISPQLFNIGLSGRTLQLSQRMLRG